MPREQTDADVQHWRANAHELVAAGKLQKWEIIKWSTTINLALAAAVTTNSTWVPRAWVLSGLVAFLALALIGLTTQRMNGARKRLDAANTYFSEHPNADVGSGNLDVRAVIFKEAEGVLHREADGFPVDQCRVAYLRFLRRGRKQSPRGEADAELAKARSEWLRLRSAERMRELVPAETFNEAIDTLAGLTLTAMASIPARLFPYAHNLAERKRCEGVIRQVRQELADKALRRAGKLREEIEQEPAP
jgi:hypothetical protein